MKITKYTSHMYRENYFFLHLDIPSSGPCILFSLRRVHEYCSQTKTTNPV